MNGPEVSIEELSRLIDGQLSQDEETSVRQRLESCAISRRLLEGMREVHAELAAAILEHPPVEDAPRSPGCLDEDTLMLLSEGKLPAESLRAAEAHAAGCARCLRALLLEMRSQTSMKSARWRDLPPEVTGHPWLRGLPMAGKAGTHAAAHPQTPAGEAPMEGKRAAPKAEEIVGHGSGVGGLERLEAEAAAQEQEQELAVTGEMRHAVSSRNQTQRSFAAGEFSIIVTLRGTDGQTANLEIQVLKQRQPLWEAEVSVAEQGTERKIFRGLSSRDGRVLIRKLKVGGYDIIVPAAELRVTLAVTS